MRRSVPALALCLSILLAGCGATPAPGSARWSREANFRQTELVVPLLTALPRALSFAATQGADYQLAGASADEAFSLDGTARPATWHFEFYGHAKGQHCLSLLQLQVGPDGVPFLAPNQHGCQPGDPDAVLAPAAPPLHCQDPVKALQTVLAVTGVQYPPTTAISWSLALDRRSGHMAMTYAWMSHREAVDSYVTSTVDATSGREIRHEALRP